MNQIDQVFISGDLYMGAVYVWGQYPMPLSSYQRGPVVTQLNLAPAHSFVFYWLLMLVINKPDVNAEWKQVDSEEEKKVTLLEFILEPFSGFFKIQYIS